MTEKYGRDMAAGGKYSIRHNEGSAAQRETAVKDMYPGSASDSGCVRLDPPHPTIRPFVFNLV